MFTNLIYKFLLNGFFMLKLLTCLIAVRISKQIRNSYIKKCVWCGAELDIEDYLIQNWCWGCGNSQDNNKIYVKNSELNNCVVIKNV